MAHVYDWSSSVRHSFPSLPPPLLPSPSPSPSHQDEETTFRTNKTNLLHSTDFKFAPASSIIGPKAEVIPSSGPTPTEQSLQQAQPLSQTLGSQQKPQPVNHTTPPQPLQQVLQPQYKGEDQHSWYYKDPQSNVQGERRMQCGLVCALCSVGWCVRCACGLVCALCSVGWCVRCAVWAGVCVVLVGWCVRCACGLVCVLCMWAGVCIMHVHMYGRTHVLMTTLPCQLLLHPMQLV